MILHEHIFTWGTSPTFPFAHCATHADCPRSLLLVLIILVLAVAGLKGFIVGEEPPLFGRGLKGASELPGDLLQLENKRALKPRECESNLWDTGARKLTMRKGLELFSWEAPSFLLIPASINVAP